MEKDDLEKKKHFFMLSKMATCIILLSTVNDRWRGK